jgi:hypothetical protein
MKDEVCLPLDDETGGIWFFPRVPITAATIIAIMMTAMRAAIAMSILLFLYHGLNKEEKLSVLVIEHRSTQPSTYRITFLVIGTSSSPLSNVECYIRGNIYLYEN